VTRYAVYGVPGIDEGAPPVAVALRERVESWYAERPEATVDPRRYGFHATLKAPFRLAEGVDADDLDAAVAALAASRPSVVLAAVRPASIGRFRALVPTGDTEAVDALAEDVVRGLDGLRAPLTRADIARRRPESLTPRQRELLEAWGYPYVLDEFRLHMTLTDSLDEPGDVDDAIAAHFADLAGADVPLTALAVFVEQEPGAPFSVRSVHPLGAARPEILPTTAAEEGANA
jgi:transposase